MVEAKTNQIAKFSKSHFTTHGARLPTPEFVAAVGAAAIDITHLSCRKSMVMIGMANEEALAHTVPLFLRSLRRASLSGGRQRGASLDRHLVLVAWSEQALADCRALQGKGNRPNGEGREGEGKGKGEGRQGKGEGREEEGEEKGEGKEVGEGYGHQCVRDAEHSAGTGSFGFHDAGFNSLGFAKIKYILNGLSLGHDVVFLDTDIVVLRDPVPYFLSRRADLFGSMEKCMIYNDTHAFHSPEFLRMKKRPPPINIGVLYFKATAGVTRCVYNWMWDMHSEVQGRPRIWDQDIYGKVMIKCTATHSLRFQVLDPRLFQSACFPFCGCTYDDDVITRENIGRFSKGQRGDDFGRCGPQHWGGWLMRHFPCAGMTRTKAELMQNLLEGYYDNKTAQINRQ
ncbi:hypothetical protein HYH03_001406 [Edaphochlamys debaryana]|uniref:Glycosyltransferase n=1 Tax=Edaphochlamys debaryana TaxID=47281 RepID=A0A835YF64_9CHLO|nr:hypothetical protein HYH03_001406 [Edaphochlamys debaryana]|eukprot:KAG2500639.1 hypothetical protein HYH03_001406 [Edaphochlamys debaryana]